MNDERPEPLDGRVLVLAPTARDAAMTRDLLNAAGLGYFLCNILADVCREATLGAGAAIVTAEAILGDTAECLSGWLHTQPPWSDFPLIVLTPPGSDSPRLLKALEAIGHMTLIKRPVQVSTLVSTVRSALRDRLRQYAVRDLLEERRRDAEALREERERFHTIFEGSMDAIVTTNDEGRYVEVNPSACELFGLSRAQLLEHRISDFAEPDFPFDAAWQSFLEQGQTTGEFRIVRPDGTVKETEFAATAHILPGRHLSIIRDVTERKQASEVLRQSEERHRFLAEVTTALVGSLHYQSILRQVADLSVPTLGDFCFFDVLTADDRLERVGWKHIDPGKKVLSERVRAHVPPRDAVNHPIIRTLRTGEPEFIPEVTESWLRSAATSAEHLDLLRELDIHSVITVPMLVGERRHGTLMFCYSLSRRQHTSEDLRLAQEIAHRAALTVENAKLFNQLRDSDRKKDEFLAVLAHELRNPLAPLTNALQIMRLTAMPGHAAQVRDMMQRQVQQMTRLVDDLLDVSRISSGKIALRKERLDVSEVMLAALETSRPLIDAANHKLTVTPSPVPLYLEFAHQQ
jgi:PAS domain S-box-containing protein